eukprot:jgi/Mesvir1/9962/Mv05754-RA.1
MAAFLPVPLVLPRDASPRETRDVLRSVEGVCRYHDLPRPFIKVVNKTKDLVAELGNDDYVVTELRKGEYCLLALVRVRGGRTVCAIVHGDRNVSIVRMPPFKTKLFKGTVAAGVLGRDPLGRSVFYVHDCLAFARHSLLHRPFLDRMEYARQLADMNFPSVGSYYIHTFIKCLSFLESNADHRGMESHNMLFLPRGAPSHMSYVAGGVPILLENKSGDVEDRGFLTRPSRPSGFSLFSLSPPSWGRTIPRDSPAMKESEEADPVAMVVVKLPEEMTNEELAKERARLLALNNGNENAEAVKRIQAYIEAREIEQSAARGVNLIKDRLLECVEKTLNDEETRLRSVRDALTKDTSSIKN